MANPTQAIRLGIIGCGTVAYERHLPALLRLRGACVVAVADPEAARMDAIAGRLGVGHRFADYLALLDLPDVDAVAVLTPTGSHMEIGLAALDAGKHVLIEKPLALSAAECEQLVKRAEASSLKTVVCFNLRWHRLVQRARTFLATGALGRVKAIRSAYTHDRCGVDAPDWHRTLELGGGVSFNEGVHHFDLWRLLLNSEVERIYSISNASEFYEDETNVVAARMTGGELASAFLTFKTAPNSELEIYGESGRLLLSLYRFDGLQFFPGSAYPGDIKERLRNALSTLKDLPRWIPVVSRGGDFPATFEGVWRHFIDCIRYDKRPECSFEDGMRAVEIAAALTESLRSGRAVRMEPKST